jgi:hypothetical protein
VGPLVGQPLAVHALAVASDGTRLAAAADRSVRLWELPDRREARRLPAGCGTATLLSFSPDGRLLAVGGAGPARLWDLAAGRQRWRFGGATTRMVGLGFGPDGQSLLIGDRDQGVLSADLVTGWLAPPFGLDVSQRLDSLALAPGGRVLALGKKDAHPVFNPPLELWDPAGGQRLRWFDREAGRRIAFINDHTIAATHPTGAGLWLWDAAVGRVVGTFQPNPPGEVGALAVAPDGRTLATAHDDLISVWEVATRRPVEYFRGHLGRVLALAFSRDGRTLISGGADGTILFWDLTGQLDRPTEVPAAERPLLWEQLADPDPAVGRTALWGLVAAPDVALPLVREKLRPLDSVPRWVAELDSTDFRTRERASRSIAQLGDLAEVPLGRLVQAGPPPERRQRLERLLARLAPPPPVGPADDPRGVDVASIPWKSSLWKERAPPAPERLRRLRLTELLEQIGTPDARDLLRRLHPAAPP